MNFKIILFFLTASTFGKIISSRKKHHDSGIEGLEWLFDIENNELDDEKSTVCDTDDCEALAKELLRGVNESVDPCENFYEFACGSWKKNHPIPPYTPVWGRPYMFQQMVYHRLKAILETKPERNDILPVRQAKKWYRSCMNTEALEKRGLKPIESILMQVGGWPMTIDAEEWDESEHSWQRIEQHYFQITGSYVFYKFAPLWYRDSTVEMEKGDLPLLNKLPFKFQNYEGEEYENYKDFISSVIQMFVEHNSANISHKMIEKDVRDLIEFEKQLAMIPKYDDEPEMTFEEFQEWYDKKTVDKGNKINVKKLMNQLLEMVNHDVKEFSDLTADSMGYFVQLNELLNETPKRTIVNYIHWHFVSDILAATTEKMRDIFFTLMENEFGVKEREPRWIECTKEMKMVKATAYAFAEKYFSKEVDTNVRTMVGHISDEMKLQIEKSNWLDDATKKIATDKLEKMGLFVGTPDWYKNSTHVLNSYKGLVIGVDHFDNVLSYKKYEIREKLRKSLANEIPIEDEEVDPLVVNAYYDPYANLMVLPAADLQPPFFTVNLPHNVNYGMIGAVIGHEIGHAYDVDGLKIGLEEDNFTISEQMMDMYYKRAECFIDQFNNYLGATEPEYDGTTPGYGKGSPGRKTQGENMADTTGLQAVYKAWKRLIENDGSDRTLPGFEKYSNDQMFFIGFGSLWCTASTDQYAKELKERDEHSPMDLRVLGAVSNSDEFARAFNCPKDSPMNPDNKCNIWKSIEEHTASKKVNRGRKHKKHHPWVLNW
ncbi:neprilysin [Microplitis demolitor]|uniref:neprilysin n=1 Tax=Microplitis demolitor TaxID=69319 RepID=UPI0004CDD9DE|nr:neprilysin [Microplitis demolitor]